MSKHTPGTGPRHKVVDNDIVNSETGEAFAIEIGVRQLSRAIDQLEQDNAELMQSVGQLRDCKAELLAACKAARDVTREGQKYQLDRDWFDKLLPELQAAIDAAEE